ncbi:DUF28-domain-containing protein [Crucibulum laeve]|uniref:DUF28-domain-containing protein n=1 Tax=Crucibulum laeve TaxID=68775 RepID=A0A5C3MP01_9AGAR|nr:DUF28-domain-containing protein [Crucibulum laeve]
MFNVRRFIPRSLLLHRSFTLSKPTFSGHNKWSKIKQKKGANDQQKSVIYGRANREIMVAVREGGSGDPNLNVQLATVLKRVKELGVPRENIEKALTKATGGKGKGSESLMYEAIAFNSVGIMIECLTDNANRTLHSVREVLNEHGARLTAVKFMFQRKGYVKVALGSSELELSERVESLIDIALGADAEDFEETIEDGISMVEFTCPPEKLATLTSAILSCPTTLAAELQESALIFAPTDTSERSEELESKLAELVEGLEGNEDVLQVWTTLDL